MAKPARLFKIAQGCFGSTARPSSWKPQLTAFFRWIRLMNSSFCAHRQGHLNSDNAPHPIEPRWRTPAALLLLALRSWQRRRPCRPQSSQRLAFFALSKCARAHLEPQRSALQAHSIAAHSGASNGGFQVESPGARHPLAAPMGYRTYRQRRRYCDRRRQKQGEGAQDTAVGALGVRYCAGHRQRVGRRWD